ncbi:MAG: hypothetical protein ABSG40_23260, partial [Terriglobales bacterium]
MRRVEVRNGVAKVRPKWGDFGCAGAESRAAGCDQDENCFTLTRTKVVQDNDSRYWGSKRRSRIKRLAVVLTLAIFAPCAASQSRTVERPKILGIDHVSFFTTAP